MARVSNRNLWIVTIAEETMIHLLHFYGDGASCGAERDAAFCDIS